MNKIIPREASKSLDTEKVIAACDSIQNSGHMPDALNAFELASFLVGMMSNYIDLDEAGDCYGVIVLQADILRRKAREQSFTDEEMSAIDTAIQLLASVVSRRGNGVRMTVKTEGMN